MVSRLLAAFALLLLLACNGPRHQQQEDLTRWVNPYIGTGAHGHVFLGANVPFGAIQLGPVNRTEGWDWCSGYNYADSTIIGFSHTRLSGTGIGDLGDVLLMPVTGDVKPVKGEVPDYNSGYYSLFSHADEKVTPGYYSVYLPRYQVKAELTATTRTGVHQYHFPKNADAGIMLDLKEGVGWDRVTGTSLRVVNDTTVEGERYSTGWAKDQRIFFTAVFSSPITSLQLYEDTLALPGNRQERGMNLKAHLRFQLPADSCIRVKVGISPVSVRNAYQNIQTEVPGWDFDAVVQQAKEMWNKELGKIKIETADTARLHTFYTAMYHTMMAPAVFNDVNGEYRGADGKVYASTQHTQMTIFSLWDTYRAANPYYTLVQQERVKDMVQSLLTIYQQQGRLPVWHLAGNETNTMPGNSAVPVVVDALLKGIKGIDTALAWEAVKQTMMGNERGLNYIKQYGFIPADSMIESVAMAMEYAIDDAAIALLARSLGKKDDEAYFTLRGLNYRKYFDESVRFMRGKTAATTWRTPFSPQEARHMNDDFCEGNSWQYTWLVPQDVEGLMQLLGGETAFIQKLDSLFSMKADMGKEASADITGLIGLYAHGNEPGHHIPYLYAYAGQPWKTAGKVRFIMDSLYNNTAAGLCGNEDAGQMSAWYILSALGFYQVNPSDGLFILGSPVVDAATLDAGDGKTFRITVKNNSAANPYIQQVFLNGKELTRSYFTYTEFKQGGELQLLMGPQPSEVFGVAPASRPYSRLTHAAGKP